MEKTSTEILASGEFSKRERRHLRREEKGHPSGGKNRSLTYFVGFLVLVFAIAGAILFAGRGSGTVVGQVTPPNENDHVRGSLTAKAVLIEYSDFECPACGSYFPYIEDMKKEFGNDLAVIYRHFPLTQHKNAKNAAIAAEAAGKQGKFWEMHDVIFRNQSAWTGKDDTSEFFAAYAKEIGLDVAKFQTDLTDKALEERVENDTLEGMAARIASTPSFFLNGGSVTPQNPNELKTLVAEAIKGTN